MTAIYARKSTDQSGVADENKSVTRQVENARAYALRKGWHLLEEHVYVDDGVSGAIFGDGRPGFWRLMNALQRGRRAPFDVLIMSEESRLGREQQQVGYAFKQLVSAGVRIFLYLEDRERVLESATDKFMLSVATFADEMERERARQRTRDAMMRKAKAGHVTGGRVFGYDNVRLETHVERRINDAEARVVRRIFELAALGHGHRSIAHTLNLESVPALLQADVFSAAIDTAINRIEQAQNPARGLDAEREKLASELSHLAAAVATGGQVPTLLAEIRKREERIKAIDAVLARPRFDRASLRAALEAKLDDWKRLLRSRPTHGQRVLRTILDGPISIGEATAAGVQWSARGSLRAFLGTLYLQVASPTGTVISCNVKFSGRAA